MGSQATQSGIYAGLALGLIYIAMCARSRKGPTFTQFATVMLCTVGAFVGGAFGLTALRATDADLAGLSDQRLPMILGAVAVVWISLEQLLAVFRLFFAGGKRGAAERLTGRGHV